MRYRGREIGCLDYRIASKFDKQIGSSRCACQISDRTILNTNLAASRLHEMLRENTLSDIETEPRGLQSVIRVHISEDMVLYLSNIGDHKPWATYNLCSISTVYFKISRRIISFSYIVFKSTCLLYLHHLNLRDTLPISTELPRSTPMKGLTRFPV